MVRCNQQASTYEPLGNTPLRVSVAEKHEKRQGRSPSPPRYPPRRQKYSPPRHNSYRWPRSPYHPWTDKQAAERGENSPVAGHVATITSRIHGVGDSRNSRKKYARREVYGVMKPGNL
ncbi:hypothetical protein LIER_39111 [Lithospermum erythrorhizon]|uniref:Uncharacterized protein n=1 Tax=Lithospermum erythrorhizon TaxID=34254 RepID=A0AAV3QC38_LITER